LAVLSAVGGWIGVPHVLSDMIGYIPNFLEHWFHHSIKTVPGWTAGEHSVELGLMGGSVLLAIIFAGLAYYLYVNVPEKPKAIAASLGKFYELVFNKYLIDELYFKTIINPLVNGSRNLWFYVDVNVIDKTTYAVADLSKGLGQFVRGLQNGNVQQYAMYLAIGLVVTISFIFVR
jgi:NADH-quinone oxidoreductase subunit L